MKLLLVPDIHLGKSTSLGIDATGSGINSRILDQDNLLKFVLEQAVINEIDRIVLLGDIWEDPNPKPIVVYLFIKWLNSCISKGIDVDIIQGNHDFCRTGNQQISMLNCLDALNIPGVNVIDRMTSSNIANMDILYIPYTDRRQLECKTNKEALDKLSEKIIRYKESFNKDSIKVVFGHLALEGSIWLGNEIDDNINEIMCSSDMFSGFDYVLMGHVHKPQVLLNSKPYMAHVGSLDKTSFGEGQKEIIVFDTEKLPNLCRIYLPTRNLVDINIVIPENVDETEYLMNEIKKQSISNLTDSIVRIKVETVTADSNYIDRNRIKDLLDSCGVFHLASLNETKKTTKILDNVKIDETIDHNKAVNMYIEDLNAEEAFKTDLLLFCQKVLSENKTK